SMNGGAKSIIGNASLVQSLPFPRIVLPIAIVFQNLLNFIPTFIFMALLAMMWGGRPDWDWFLFIPLVFLFWIFSEGVAFIFARVPVHFRDLSHDTTLLSRMIFYPSSVSLELNPMVDKINHALHPFADWQ